MSKYTNPIGGVRPDDNPPPKYLPSSLPPTLTWSSIQPIHQHAIPAAGAAQAATPIPLQTPPTILQFTPPPIPTPIPQCPHLSQSLRYPGRLQQANPTRSWSRVWEGKNLRTRSQRSKAAWKGPSWFYRRSNARGNRSREEGV